MVIKRLLNKLIKISNALNIPVDILLGNELSSYNMEKLLDIEKQLKKLPLQEQQRILEIIDSIIEIELRHMEQKG